MEILKRKSSVVLCFIAFLICAVGAMPSFAQEKMMVAGQSTYGWVTRDTLFVDDVEGHYQLLAKMAGFNISTGEKPFMNNAKLELTGFGDYISQKGGPHQGYFWFTSKEGRVFCRYEGKTSFETNLYEGTLSFIKGTGQFENIQGTGAYKAVNKPGRLLIVEWLGTYHIPKMTR